MDARLHINIAPAELDLEEGAITPADSAVELTATGDGFSVVKIAPIPADRVIPSGVVYVEKNGTYDIYDAEYLYIDINSGMSLRKYCEEGYTDIVDPGVTELDAGFFCYDTMLRSISLPSCVSVSGTKKAFEGCTALREISLPSCNTIGADALGESGVTSLVLGPITLLASDSLAGCTQLTRLDLRRCGRVPTLEADAMTDTPLWTDIRGEILVPKALENDFKIATNWARMAAIIRGVE